MHKTLLSFFCLLAFTSQAIGSEFNSDRISISLAGFFVDRDTGARLEGEVPGSGTDINLEGDLGLETSGTVFRLDTAYRFNNEHRVDLAFFDLSRKSDSKIIDREIQFGDQTYAVNTQVDSRLDLLIIKLAYTYSFLLRDEGFLGASFGFYTASTKAEIRTTSLVGSAESDSLTAPLPVIGLRGEYQIAPRWTLRGSTELFQLKINDIEGRLVDLFAGVDFLVHNKISVGLGYNYAETNIDSSNEDFAGGLDWTYDGLMLYGKIGFGGM